MGRKFDIPIFYRSPLITTIKSYRKTQDSRKQDLAPSVIDLNRITFKVARHFGFCFGVENAIEIAYKAVKENPGKRVFLLSEMIHNPHVNSDLMQRGVRFLQTTEGKQLINFEELKSDDIVIVPAFGTTVSLYKKLESLGIDLVKYNATCPFVEKVWKRAKQLGERGYTIVIHGKHQHEETRATFSHSVLSAPAVVVRDVAEAELLAKYISRQLPLSSFLEDFNGKISPGFDPDKHLDRIGVVNQTTMLATETQVISDLLRKAIENYFIDATDLERFADTRDTLCYATSENQDAVHSLVKSGGDLALVVGGYNSSNTSHLVEICEEYVPTYYIKDADEIIDLETIRHLKWREPKVVESKNWLPSAKDKISVLITAGASCPDTLVEEVIKKVSSFFELDYMLENTYENLLEKMPQNLQ
jgi:4-hydroxy-3-methylbut-2-enyl diphosphate reductase